MSSAPTLAEITDDPTYRFSCRAFTNGQDENGEKVPNEHWFRYDLEYPNGRTLTMVYDCEPDVPDEPAALALQLQVALGQLVGVRLFATNAYGERREAPPIYEGARLFTS